jgi:hypothetical protein
MRAGPSICCLLLGASCTLSTAGGAGLSPAAASWLRAPFGVPRPSFFHAALLVPELQPAAAQQTGTLLTEVGSYHADAKSTRTFEGVTSSFAGSYHEWIAAELHWGALPRVELSLRSAVAGWDEVLDHFLLRDASGNLIVKDEERLEEGMASQRHENVARVDLGAKIQLLGGDDSTATTSIAGGLKLPLARPGDLTSAGTTDLAATLLETVRLGAWTLHANGGGVWPLGDQTLFHANEGIKLDPFAQGAVGVNLQVDPLTAFDLQLQANTSAFRDVPFLREGPITAVLGVRRWFGATSVELAAGHGFDHESSDVWEAFITFAWIF